jgi:regulator of sigma E protease
MYIIVAIIAFGVLIAIHELGHFSAAKLLGVRVNEFAIGMGPKLLKKQGKETLYTLRALPFGGFCSMEGENEGSEDPRSFTSQKRWRRVIILFAGSAANIVAAFIIVVILTSGANAFVGTTITELVDGFPSVGEDGLMVGDTIVSINGERLYYVDDFSLFMQLARSGQVDLVIRRGGETISLNSFPLERREYMTDGEMRLRYGITFNVIEASAFEKLKFSGYQTMNYVRLIRVSIAQLINGTAGIQDLSGPVGIVDAMNNIGQTAPSFGIALASIVGFMAFIGVNLAIVNLLPIPALDGGRIVLVFITWAIEGIIRRRLDPKYEGYIHAGALVLLMGFMVFILVNDMLKLISG